jgi:hypothetical protein
MKTTLTLQLNFNMSFIAGAAIKAETLKLDASVEQSGQ